MAKSLQDLTVKISHSKINVQKVFQICSLDGQIFTIEQLLSTYFKTGRCSQLPEAKERSL